MAAERRSGRVNSENRFSTISQSTCRLRQHTAELTTTSTPATSVGMALAQIRRKINPRLYQGIQVMKICSNGKMVSRVVTLSRDNFLIFVTPSKIPGSESSWEDLTSNLEFLAQKVRRTSREFKKAVVTASMGEQHTPRHIDIADITHVQHGFVGTRKLEKVRCSSVSGSSSSQQLLIQDVDSIISIFHHDQNTIDLLISNEREREDFLSALHLIRMTYRSTKGYVGREELLLRRIWYDIDVDRNSLINLNEMRKILNRVNLYQEKHVTHEKLHKFVKKHKLDAKVGIPFVECMRFLRQQKMAGSDRSQTMEDELWERIFGPIDSVDAETFLKRFLHDTQREVDASIEDAEFIFAHLNLMEISGGDAIIGHKGLSTASIDKLRFAEYLHISLNDAYDPECLMMRSYTLNEPLSCYWINTSHNTYLTGDQLQSDSSVEMYSRSMQRGFRCLELDCWDGTKVPVIYHGYTLTSKIDFEDVIKCVEQFVDDHPDTLPIILSLENHCSPAFQRIMAHILTKTLGDKLYIPHREELGTHLPSPNSLRGKVVIKGKRPPGLEEQDDEGQDELNQYQGRVGRKEKTGEKEGEKVKLPKVIPELARLTLFHGTKFESFNKSIGMPSSHMHSFSESKISKILDKGVQEAESWQLYNHDHMTRIYPSGARVDSSNYNPVVAWSTGCQLVALNFQTSDSPLVLNDGRFRENGGCGYVLKPDLHYSTDDPTAPSHLTSLRLRILSGSCLPKPRAKETGECIDPFVTVAINDVTFREKDTGGGRQSDDSFTVSSVSSSAKSQDSSAFFVRTKSKTTRFIKGDGFSPVWDESFMEFSVHCPQVAMVHFSVKNKDVGTDETIAEAAIPLARLRSGLRSVQLCDRNGTRSGLFEFATLLVEIDVSKLTMEEHVLESGSSRNILPLSRHYSTS